MPPHDLFRFDALPEADARGQTGPPAWASQAGRLIGTPPNEPRPNPDSVPYSVATRGLAKGKVLVLYHLASGNSMACCPGR